MTLSPLRMSGRAALSLDTPRVMGVLNVTPDSFSDGGRFNDVQAAVDQGLTMARAGATLIDIGGESTRPGATRIDAQTQKARVLPVIEALRAALDQAGFGDIALSIDTTRRAVAEPALDAGASMLNDVSAGRDDPAMLSLAAERAAPIALMHMQGEPASMQQHPRYNDVVEDVHAFLTRRTQAAVDAGVEPSQVVLDPGIGFGKTTEHNLTLLRRLDRFVATGQPVLLGTSRKRFISAVSDTQAGEAADRLGGTCAVTALAVQAGVAIIRVHDVAPNKQAADVARAIRPDPPRE